MKTKKEKRFAYLDKMRKKRGRCLNNVLNNKIEDYRNVLAIMEGILKVTVIIL